MENKTHWVKKEIDREAVKSLAGKFKCKPLVASILARRGITEGKDILFFLEDDLRFLHNPFLFKDMEDAVDRVIQAKEEGEKVLIFGDRDVDGVTGTALLYNALSAMGIDLKVRIPTGDEPYGLTVEAVERHAAEYGSLIITVDCGISCVKEIARANELGIDVIVLDHHTPPEILPEAAVIIDPHLEDSGYPFKYLSGCAVAWKFITALRFAETPMYKQSVCLLNVRPLNDAYCVEVIKTVNMVEETRIYETLVPGMVPFSKTRLPSVLEGQHIFVWDALMQKKQLEKIFGSSIEFNFLDISEEIVSALPSFKGMSLLKLKNFSKIGRYMENPVSEIESFFNIFVTYLQKKSSFFDKKTEEELQLVALGTLADIMPLKNENRILVRNGIESMNNSPVPGLLEILARQGLTGKKIHATDLSWKITPVINAAGRLGKPETALNLLLRDTTPADRQSLSEEIIRMNNDRRDMGKETWTVAEPLAKESFEKNSRRLVMAASGEINRGITGLTASRLAKFFDVPAVVLSLRPDGTAVGSMRSARGVNLKAIIEMCEDLFSEHGGHAFAAGFSLKKDKLPDLESRLSAIAENLEFPGREEGSEISIDAQLPHEYITPEIITINDIFEPFGEGNEPIHFLVCDVKIINADIMGKGEKQHLKLTLDCGKYKWPALFWNSAERYGRDFDNGDRIDAVFKVAGNFFNGAYTPQMVLVDVKKHKPETKNAVEPQSQIEMREVPI